MPDGCLGGSHACDAASEVVAGSQEWEIKQGTGFQRRATRCISLDVSTMQCSNPQPPSSFLERQYMLGDSSRHELADNRFERAQQVAQ